MSIVIGQKSINQIAQYMVESWPGFRTLLSTSGTFTRPSGDFWRVLILGDPGAVSWAGRKGATKVFKAEKPLGTDSHCTISKWSSECWLLIGHKKCFVLWCPIGKQHLLSSFREFVHDALLGVCM